MGGVKPRRLAGGANDGAQRVALSSGAKRRWREAPSGGVPRGTLSGVALSEGR